jgi:ATP-dependent protease HslVU (ClpYQ) peptidase subunit
MTTIAYDGVTLAADGRVTRGGVLITDNYNKIHIFEPTIKYKGDTLLAMAFCGSLETVNKYIDYLINADHYNYKEYVNHDIAAIIVGENSVYTLGQGGTYLTPYAKRQKLTDGSGADFAHSAMAFGYTAVEAIKHAIKQDVFSGGKINKYRRPK